MTGKVSVRRVSLKLINYTKVSDYPIVLNADWTLGYVLPKNLYKVFIDFLRGRGIMIKEGDIRSLVGKCKESGRVRMELNDRYSLVVNRWNYQRKMTELEKAFENEFSNGITV